MSQELIDAFDRADADDEVRAVVLTGAGRGFCAGADLAGGGTTFAYRDGGVHRDHGGLVSLRVFESLKPVIVAVNGPAVGVGVTMTLPADVRLASTAARFGFVFARRGIVAEAASSWFLPRLVGISRALEWAATGRVFDAREARDGGLVRSVHEPDDLLPAAYALAREIADNTAPVSVAVTRQMMWRMLGADHPMTAHEADSRAIQARGASADAREGVTAFLEKRPARFPDRVSADMPDSYPWWPDRPWTP
jgi:enoyl-CoA hydratase/carnithine racemase